MPVVLFVIVLYIVHLIYHRLRSSASPLLTATGFVNGKGQCSTPYRIDTRARMCILGFIRIALYLGVKNPNFGA